MEQCLKRRMCASRIDSCARCSLTAPWPVMEWWLKALLTIGGVSAGVTANYYYNDYYRQVSARLLCVSHVPHTPLLSLSHSAVSNIPSPPSSARDSPTKPSTAKNASPTFTNSRCSLKVDWPTCTDGFPPFFAKQTLQPAGTALPLILSPHHCCVWQHHWSTAGWQRGVEV